MALNVPVSCVCNFPYLNIENFMFLLYLNIFLIIFVGLKCEFYFNKCLRNFALLIGIEIRRSVYE